MTGLAAKEDVLSIDRGATKRRIAFAVAAAVGALLSIAGTATAASRTAALVRTAELRPSNASTFPGGEALFASTAISGGVAVAGAPGASVGSDQDQGIVYVFTERTGGWSTETEAAKLVESDGRAGDNFGRLVAISGDTVVVGGSSATRGLVLYVFTEPSTGWSGTLQETAQLNVSDPGVTELDSLAVSGNTIVIGTQGTCSPCSPGPAGYVFTRPAGGWSGTVHETAKLTVPNATYPCFSGEQSVAIDGPTIVATCSSETYVFAQPASGWSGTVTPVATLLSSSTSLSISGSTVVAAGRGTQEPADPVVFEQPANGWAGTIKPAATLKVPVQASDGFDELLATSGHEVAALAIPLNDQSCPIFPTCAATLTAFAEPQGGWHGTITGPAASINLASPDGSPLAISGSTILTGGAGAIDLLTAQPGPPYAQSSALTGVASGRPKLRLTLNGGQSAPPIRSLRFILPRGLRFANGRTDRARGVRITAPGSAVRFGGETVAVRLRQPVERLTVTVGGPALIAQQKLVAEAQRNRRHRTRRPITLTALCAVTDVAGNTTSLVVKLSVS